MAAEIGRTTENTSRKATKGLQRNTKELRKIYAPHKGHKVP